MRYLLAVLFLHIGSILFAAQDTLITRGPYLQAGTANSMVIRWRTGNAATNTIRYGSAFDQQIALVSDSIATTEHEVRIEGLLPDTKYYYSIYTDTTLLAGNDSSYYFITNPLANSTKPVHCWVIGDMGRANADQLAVRDVYWNNVRNNRHTDVWLWTGDNVYSDGTDQEYQDKMFAIYPQMLCNTVARPCPGNHDYGSINAITHDGPYYQNFTMTREGEAGGVPSNEEGYYSFDYGPIHFVSLNSENLLWCISPNTAMANWLRNDLAANTRPFVVAYWHQPPYSRGSHNSDEAFSRMSFMRTNINPVLEQYGVDLVLNGHSHNYERSFLIKGHYGNADSFDPFSMVVNNTSGKPAVGEAYTKYTTGPNANAGTVYTVIGNSGSSTTGEPLDHPVMYYSEQGICGFMTLDATADRLDARYYDQTGAMKDEFTIIKTAQNPNGQTSLKNVVSAIKIFPNPFSDFLQIEYSANESVPVTIDMFDINGRLIQQVFNGLTKSGLNRHQLLVNGIAKGNYLIKIKHAKLGEISNLVTLQ